MGNNMANSTIDGKDYDEDDLSDDAKRQAISLQWVQNEAQRTQMLLAALETAKIGYSRALKEALGEIAEGEVEIEGDELTID